jgi:hypothetical protein
MPYLQVPCALPRHHNGHCRPAEGLSAFPGGERTCGACIRGLLCRGCNTALGHIERKALLARAYKSNPPGKLLAAA